MASVISALTSGGGGISMTGDASGLLNLNSNGTNVVAVTATGATVTGTLAATGASTFTGTGKFATTIGVGNATPSASGSGITFPATQSASSDANTLDDYEEGTWTPSIGGTATYNTQGGTYIKIGGLVTVGFDLGILLRGTGSTTSISGLPFSAPNTSGVRYTGSINYAIGLAVSVDSLIPWAGSSNVEFGSFIGTAAATTNSPAIFGNNARVIGSITYSVI